jgi:ABC-type multidrug transport system fused ATPase/permease subunit
LSFFVVTYSDLNKVADGIGHKFGLFQYGISGFLAGYILAFVYGWKLTLVMMSIFPLFAVTGGALGMVSFVFEKRVSIVAGKCRFVSISGYIPLFCSVHSFNHIVNTKTVQLYKLSKFCVETASTIYPGPPG